MPEQGFLLSKNDVMILRSLIEREAGTTRNTQNRTFSKDKHVHKSQDVYLIVTPADGIQGVQLPSESGSGSSGLDQFTISYGLCQVMQVSESGTVLPGPMDLQRVYNPSVNDVPGSQLALAVKDKYGTWFIDNSGGDDNTVFFRFSGELSPDGCHYYDGNYINTIQSSESGSGSSPCYTLSMGNEINILDLNTIDDLGTGT